MACVWRHAHPHTRQGAPARPSGRRSSTGGSARAAPDLVGDLAAEEVRVLLAQRVEVQRDLCVHAAAQVVVHRPGALRAARRRAQRKSSSPLHAGPGRCSSLVHQSRPLLPSVALDADCPQHPGKPRTRHERSARRCRRCSTALTQCLHLSQALALAHRRQIWAPAHARSVHSARALARTQHAGCGGRTVSSALWPLRGSAPLPLPRSRALPPPLDDSACVAVICSRDQQRLSGLRWRRGGRAKRCVHHAAGRA
jgi:hypothetical protein